MHRDKKQRSSRCSKALYFQEVTSFEADLRPLFTDRDIHARNKAFDLAKYDDVKKHAAAIDDRIRGLVVL
jgi:hypothetical protein